MDDALDHLDGRLIALHGSGRSGDLSRLHEAAANRLGDPVGRRFHLTHAWVHALEAGDEARAARLAREIETR